MGALRRSFRRTSDRVGAGAESFIGQTAVFPSLSNNGTVTTTVPEGALFVFAEVVTGGGGSRNSIQGNAGGATDTIAPVSPGNTISITSLLSSGNSYGMSLSIPGQAAISIAVGGAAASKYPPVNVRNRAGGRLAGENGIGAGTQPNAGTSFNGPTASFALFTYFTTYDAALAFAKSVYGGSWTP